MTVFSRSLRVFPFLLLGALPLFANDDPALEVVEDEGEDPGFVLDIVPMEALSEEEQRQAREIHVPDWFAEDYADLRSNLAAAVDTGKFGLIVYFAQEECSYCDKLLEENFRGAEMKKYIQGMFEVVAIDIWSDHKVTNLLGQPMTEQILAKTQQAQLTPTLLFYDRDGSLALRLRGYYPPKVFRAALDYVVGRHYQRETFRNYTRRLPKDTDRGQLHRHALFAEPPFFLDRSIQAGTRPLAVVFEQPGCGTCDQFHGVELNNPEILRYLEGMEMVQLDMWSETPVVTPAGKRTTASAWADDLGLFYAPTLMFFDEWGEPIIQVDSVLELEHFLKILEYIKQPVHNAVKLDHLLRGFR